MKSYSFSKISAQDSPTDAPYNNVAEKIRRFMNDAKAAHTRDGQYKDLSPIMASFTDVRVKDGYILDGFQSGVPLLGSSLYLHARKENGSEFVPFDWDDYHRQRLIFSKLYGIEKEMQEAGLVTDSIQKRRQDESYKIIQEFENWMNSVSGCFTPKSRMGKA